MGPAPEYASDTVDSDTFARAATSAIVGRRFAATLLPFVFDDSTSVAAQ